MAKKKHCAVAQSMLENTSKTSQIICLLRSTSTTASNHHLVPVHAKSMLLDFLNRTQEKTSVRLKMILLLHTTKRVWRLSQKVFFVFRTSKLAGSCQKRKEAPRFSVFAFKKMIKFTQYYHTERFSESNYFQPYH